MIVFEFDDYRKYLKAKFHSLPKRGRGEVGRIARYLKMHSTAVSQVIKGSRDFTYEQACQLCEYLGLTSLETDYLLTLVLLERSGTPKMRAVIQRQLKQLRERANELSSRVPSDKRLSDSERAVFYSSWYYSAIRILTSIPGHESVGPIAERLGLPRKTVAQALEFLVQSGLCVENEGKLRIGPKHTHLEAASPLIARHHANWRLKAIEHHERLSGVDELAYSGLVSLSKVDAEKLRSVAASFVENALKRVADSDSEALYFLNLDWIQLCAAPGISKEG